MILIDSLDCLSILVLFLPWLSCSFWHVCSHCCISCYLNDWLICLYIILIIFEHAIRVAIHFDCHILIWLVCGHGWYTCALLDYLLHDCSSPVCLYVACLFGSHIYPLTSNPLVSVIPFSFGSYICRCETFNVLISLTELMVRSRVWRRAILMFVRILEEVDILMLIGVRSLKTCITQS